MSISKRQFLLFVSSAAAAAACSYALAKNTDQKDGAHAEWDLTFFESDDVRIAQSHIEVLNEVHPKKGRIGSVAKTEAADKGPE